MTRSSPAYWTTLAVFTHFVVSIAAQPSALSSAAIAYTPQSYACSPGTTFVRSAGSNQATLSPEEVEYVSKRREQVLPTAWRSYLSTVKSNAESAYVSLPSYVSDILSDVERLPTLGIATSGGGYRAALFGSGVLNALDGRNATAVEAGTGGLLQSASYLSGLSGGSWLVTSLVQANFPTIPSLIFGLDATFPDAFGGWLTQYGIMQPTSDPEVQQLYIEAVLGEIAGKREVGFPVTITDAWTRMLARHFANGTTAANFFESNVTHGAGQTWSGVKNLSAFRTHNIPFPIIVGDTVSNFEGTANTIAGDTVPLSNPLYEFNVFESGSFDPFLASFVKTDLLGSQKDTCVSGFDQVSFVAGLSSNLWNEFNVSAAVLEASSVGPLINIINETFPQSGIRLDAAAVPNPFLGVAPTTFLDSNETLLYFVDGGEDGEIVPIQPLLVKARQVDVIVAIDAASDTDDNFTSGDSIIATQARAALFPNTYSFPPVPASPDTFASNGFANRPTFFGCNSDATAPIVVYIANGGAPLGQTPVTNISTFTDTFTAANVQSVLDQTFDIATQGIPVDPTTKDPEWPACLACAVVDRARQKLGGSRSGVCESCLARYCAS